MYDSQVIAKLAEQPACTKTSLRNENSEYQNQNLFSFFSSKSLHSDNSILVLDNAVYLKWANYAYTLARCKIERDRQNTKQTNQQTYPPNLWSWFGLYEYGWYILHLSKDAIVARVHCWRKGRYEFLCSLHLIDWWSPQAQEKKSEKLR